MNVLNKWLDKIDNLLAYLSSAVLFLMMLWIFVDVSMRYVFNRTITGTLELTGEYFMVIIVYGAISFTLKEHGHVSVDFIKNKLSTFKQKILELISNLLAMSVFIILGLNNFQKGLEYFVNDIRSVGLLDYPLAPALMIISLGIFLLTFRLLFNIINIFRDKSTWVNKNA